MPNEISCAISTAGPRRGPANRLPRQSKTFREIACIYALRLTMRHNGNCEPSSATHLFSPVAIIHHPVRGANFSLRARNPMKD